MPKVTKAMRLDEAALLPPGPENYRCQQCGRAKDCATWPYLRDTSKVPGQEKVVFVSDTPTLEECIKRRHFLSPVARLFKQEVILKVGLTPENVGFVTATACYGKKGPTCEQVRMCSVFCKASIEAMHPEKVVLIGDDAVSAVLGLKNVVIKDMTSTIYPLLFGHKPGNDNVYAQAIVTYGMRTILKDYERVHHLRWHIGAFVSGELQQNVKSFPLMRIV